MIDVVFYNFFTSLIVCADRVYHFWNTTAIDAKKSPELFFVYCKKNNVFFTLCDNCNVMIKFENIHINMNIWHYLKKKENKNSIHLRSKLKIFFIIVYDTCICTKKKWEENEIINV